MNDHKQRTESACIADVARKELRERPLATSDIRVITDAVTEKLEGMFLLTLHVFAYPLLSHFLARPIYTFHSSV